METISVCNYLFTVFHRVQNIDNVEIKKRTSGVWGSFNLLTKVHAPETIKPKTIKIY